MFGPVGRWLQANQGFLALLAFVATIVIGCLQVEQANPAPAPAQAPARVAPLDRDAIGRSVEEGLREQAVPVDLPTGKCGER